MGRGGAVGAAQESQESVEGGKGRKIAVGVRFVHAADLHLGSPMEGVTEGMPAELARQVREASLTTLRRLVTLCQEQAVDFLLVAGDLYEQSDRDVRSLLGWRRAVEELERSHVPVFLVYGNHDDLGRQTVKLTWPGNLRLFPAGEAQMEVWTRPPSAVGGRTIRLFGISYPQRQVRENYAQRLQRLRAAQRTAQRAAVDGMGTAKAYGATDLTFDIGLLHANVNGSAEETYAPVALAELLQAEPGLGPFDYWALGHVHERAILHSSEPVVAYPGNTQGRGFAEPGWRGVYLVTVPDDLPPRQPPRAPQVDFVPVQAIVWHTVQVQVDEGGSEDDLARALERQIPAVAQEYRLPAGQPGFGPLGVMLRIEVTGRSKRLYHWLASEPTRTQLLEDLRDMGRNESTPWVWPAVLGVDVQVPIDWEKLQHEEGFVGDLARLGQALQEALAGSAQAAATRGGQLARPSTVEPGQLLQEWLQPLRAKKGLAAWLDQLPAAELQRWVAAAQARLVEDLLGEGE